MTTTTWHRSPIRWDRDLALQTGITVPQLWSQLRRKLDLTQQDVADVVGVTRQAVTTWEAGLREPSDTNVKKLLGLLSQARQAPEASEPL